MNNLVAAFLIVLSSAGIVAGEPSSFQGLGALETGSFASDVSSDGMTVVGNAQLAGITHAFRWSEKSGLVWLSTFPGGPFNSAALAASADGTVIVGLSEGRSSPMEAVVWPRKQKPVGLGFLWPSQSLAWGVSADGTVVVGRSGIQLENGLGSRAFIWSQATGMIDLGTLPGGVMDSVAYDVSSDGSVVVGISSSNAGYLAFMWTKEGGMVSLGDLPGGSHLSSAQAVCTRGDTACLRFSSRGRFAP